LGAGKKLYLLTANVNLSNCLTSYGIVYIVKAAPYLFALANEEQLVFLMPVVIFYLRDNIDT
jgi:hypothetical protein